MQFLCRLRWTTNCTNTAAKGRQWPGLLLRCSREVRDGRRGRPLLQVVFTDVHGIDVCVTQQSSDTMREVGVEDKLHCPAVASGSSRSCTAAAAYSSAAVMSASSRSGKSSRISSAPRPVASWEP